MDEMWAEFQCFWLSHSATLNPQRAEVPYMEQNHLHGQQQEFCIRNNAQKMKESDVKIILSSLAYVTPIRLLFCVSKGERERNFWKKKKI